MKEGSIELAAGDEVLIALTRLKNGKIEDAVADFAENFCFNDRGLGLEFTDKERLLEFFPERARAISKLFFSDK